MILPLKIETLMWLLPIVFMLHDFEEIIMFKPWVNVNRAALERRLPASAARIFAKHASISTSAYALAVAEEFIILSALTLLAVELNLYELWAGITLGFLAHLLIHAGQFVAYRRYVPVILTSLPCGLYCLAALRDLTLFRPLDWNLVALWTLVSLMFIGVNLVLALKLAAKFDAWLENNFRERN